MGTLANGFSDDDAKAPAAKVLQKWRPHVLPSAPPKAEKPLIGGAEPSGGAGIDVNAGVAKAEEIKSPTNGMPVAAAG